MSLKLLTSLIINVSKTFSLLRHLLLNSFNNIFPLHQWITEKLLDLLIELQLLYKYFVAQLIYLMFIINPSNCFDNNIWLKINSFYTNVTRVKIVVNINNTDYGNKLAARLILWLYLTNPTPTIEDFIVLFMHAFVKYQIRIDKFLLYTDHKSQKDVHIKIDTSVIKSKRFDTLKFTDIRLESILRKVEF